MVTSQGPCGTPLLDICYTTIRGLTGRNSVARQPAFPYQTLRVALVGGCPHVSPQVQS